jgi:microcystin degradation protein MlrC
LIASHPTYDWCNEQYESVDLDVRQAKFVVVKNPMNFHMTYDEIAAGVFVLDTPGPTPATFKHTEFKRLKRPYFPLDDDIPGLKPVVYRSKQTICKKFPAKD